MLSTVGTWKFSADGVAAAHKALSQGKTAVEAVELGVRVVEEDPAVTSVGYGGLPNADGILQLDAAIMTGDGALGSVRSSLHNNLRNGGTDQRSDTIPT